jgi:hypothetical protein
MYVLNVYTHYVILKFKSFVLAIHQVLTAASVKMYFFSDAAPCSLPETDRSFKGAYCDDDSARTSETSVHFQKTTQRNIAQVDLALGLL